MIGFPELLRRALTHTDDLAEALVAAEIALSMSRPSGGEGDVWGIHVTHTVSPETPSLPTDAEFASPQLNSIEYSDSSPGKGWVFVGEGPKGGRKWEFKGQVATAQPTQTGGAPATPEPSVATPSPQILTPRQLQEGRQKADLTGYGWSTNSVAYKTTQPLTSAFDGFFKSLDSASGLHNYGGSQAQVQGRMDIASRRIMEDVDAALKSYLRTVRAETESQANTTTFRSAWEQLHSSVSDVYKKIKRTVDFARDVAGDTASPVDHKLKVALKQYLSDKAVQELLTATRAFISRSKTLTQEKTRRAENQSRKNQPKEKPPKWNSAETYFGIPEEAEFGYVTLKSGETGFAGKTPPNSQDWYVAYKGPAGGVFWRRKPQRQQKPPEPVKKTAPKPPEPVKKTAPKPPGQLPAREVDAAKSVQKNNKQPLQLPAREVEGTKMASLSLEDDQPPYEEAFGTEAPGVGWIYCGELRWVRGLPRGKCSEE